MDRENLDEPRDEVAAAEEPSPLSEEQFAVVRRAVRDRKGFERLIRRSGLSAAITLIIGVACVGVAVLWPDWENIAAAVVLCAVGAVELWGHNHLRRGSAGAATVLGVNQLVLLVLIAAYCAVQMAAVSPESVRQSAMLADLRARAGGTVGMQKAVQEQVEHWVPMVAYGFYGLIIALSAVVQVRSAVGYFAGRRHVESFQQGTPAWVRRLLAEMGR